MEINGKQYRLVEAYMIPKSEVETVWPRDYGDEEGYAVDLARKDMEVKPCFVLVEVAPSDQATPRGLSNEPHQQDPSIDLDDFGLLAS